MRPDLLKLSHNDPSSRHMGVNRCVERIEIIDIECVMMTNHVSTFSPCVPF